MYGHIYLNFVIYLHIFPPYLVVSVSLFIQGAYAEYSPVLVISGAPGIKEEGHDTLIHHSIYKQEDSVQRRMFQEGKLGEEVYIE